MYEQERGRNAIHQRQQKRTHNIPAVQGLQSRDVRLRAALQIPLHVAQLHAVDVRYVRGNNRRHRHQRVELAPYLQDADRRIDKNVEILRGKSVKTITTLCRGGRPPWLVAPVPL